MMKKMAQIRLNRSYQRMQVQSTLCSGKSPAAWGNSWIWICISLPQAVKPVNFSETDFTNIAISTSPTSPAISVGIEIKDDKNNAHQHINLKSVSPESDVEELKNYSTECIKPEKKNSRCGRFKPKCCCCSKEPELCTNLKRLFCPISWPIVGVVALVVSAMLIMLEFSADTGFCYFNPVIPLTVVPLSTPRGISQSPLYAFSPPMYVYISLSHCKEMILLSLWKWRLPEIYINLVTLSGFLFFTLSTLLYDSLYKNPRCYLPLFGLELANMHSELFPRHVLYSQRHLRLTLIINFTLPSHHHTTLFLITSHHITSHHAPQLQLRRRSSRYHWSETPCY